MRGIAIKLFIKYSGWDRKSHQEKDVIKRRLDGIKYRLDNVLANFACLIPFPLGSLFSYFGSDKERREGGHHYGASYAKFLRRFRYRPIKFLEIGIGGYNRGLGGASLLAWQAFFPFARIVGCDVVPKFELATWRTRIYAIDQSSATDLARLAGAQGPFDVIIDDGSHMNAHQIFAFRKLFDALKDGGLYIVEDVQTSYWTNFHWDGRHIDDPEFPDTCVGYFLELAKYLNYQEFVDDRGVNPELQRLASAIKRISFEHNLIFIEKGRNDSPSNHPSARYYPRSLQAGQDSHCGSRC